MDVNEIEVTYFLVFMKVDENYKIINDEKYELLPISGKETTGIYSTIGSQGQYRLNGEISSSGNSNLAKSFVPQFILDDISSVNSLQEVENKYKDKDAYQYNYFTGVSDVVFYLPYKLKQTQTKEGYKNSDIYVTGRVTVSFWYNTDGSIESKYISILIDNNVLGYDISNVKPVNNEEDIVYYNNAQITHGDACINTSDSGTIIIGDESLCTYEDDSYNRYSSYYNVVPYFVSKKATVTLEIKNTVNNVSKYDASKDKNLEYQITIKNTGNITSTNNVIVTYVPKEVEVNKNGISDNGTYNQNNHTITWVLGAIEANESKTLTYKATAPKETHQNLVGHSTIKSDQVAKEVISNDTVVVVEKEQESVNAKSIEENPNTANFGPYLLYSKPFLLVYSVLLIIVVTITVKFIKKRLKINRYRKET